MMSMTGHQFQAAIVMALAALVNIGLNLILIPEFGIIGGGYSSIVALTLSSVLMATLAYRYTGINPTIFCKFKI